MFTVVEYRDDQFQQKSLHVMPLEEGEQLPKGWTIIKTGMTLEMAHSYRNECLADRHLLREEQRAADRQWEK